MAELSEQDVAHIAAAVADELHQNPPRLSDEDVSRIAAAVTINLLKLLRQPPPEPPIHFRVPDFGDRSTALESLEDLKKKYGEPVPPKPGPEVKLRETPHDRSRSRGPGGPSSVS